MRSSSLRSSRWLAALGIAATLMGGPAAAVEELVVYGTAQPAVSAAAVEALRQDMTAYVETLYAEQRARINAALSQGRATEIRIAAAKIPTRG